MNCEICVEPLNKSNHSPSICNFCHLTACKQCIRTFLGSSASEPKCMKCNTAWDNEFVLQAVNKTYYHSQLKDKKKDKGKVYATQKHIRIELQNQWRHSKKCNSVKPMSLSTSVSTTN